MNLLVFCALIAQAAWTPAAHRRRTAGSARRLDQRHHHAARAAGGTRWKSVLHQGRSRGLRKKHRRERQRRPAAQRYLHRRRAGLQRSLVGSRDESRQDPADVDDCRSRGREIAALTADGERRAAALAEQRRLHPADGPENRGLTERCILWPTAGPPMLPGPYNDNYQIFQSPGLCRHRRRNDSRRAHHSFGQSAAPALERAPVVRRCARPLGRQHPGRRNHEFHRQNAFSQHQRQDAR